MRLLGYDITVSKATPNVPGNTLLPPYSGYGGWFNVIRESFPGAWQRNVEIRLDNVMTFSAVYACVTLIAQDIGKLCLDLVQRSDDDDVWEEVGNPAFSPVLRKPNHFQTRQKFIEQWVASKIIHGNTYVLKERDNRGVVTRMYVLDPQVTRVLIAPDGEIFYQLSTNRLAGVDALIGIDTTSAAAPGVDQTEVTSAAVYVPASEIIHDIYVPIYHPLVGVSPISACGLAAVQGLAIQNNSAKFFKNGSHPGGVLVAPGEIGERNAKEIKDYWEQNFTGENSGRVAVLSDGMKYEALTISASDAQLINQLKWTSETVCTAFKVPPYMIGVGPVPSYSNVEAINLQYYTQCLQPLMEAIEALIEDGLGMLAANQSLGVEFDLDDLLKMDTNTQFRTYGEGVARGILAPNEAREKVGYGPVEGGDTPYLQQQQFGLAALAKRDASDPFSKPAPAPVAASVSANQNNKPPAQQDQQPQEAALHQFEWKAALKHAVNHARTS
jgi:HK97 family phage portal protein